MPRSHVDDEPELSTSFASKRCVAAPRFRVWETLLLLTPAAVILALILLMIIKPFSTSDQLERPVAVKGFTNRALILSDGRVVPLRFLERVPADDPVFQSALANGVEVDAKGDAYGLITVYSTCGNSLGYYHGSRTNLSELAVALHPDCIDEAIVGPELAADLRESDRYRPKSPRMVNAYFYQTIRHSRFVFDIVRARSSEPGSESDDE